jgi:hypothetical protein
MEEINMNVPTFSAEASLYKARAFYHSRPPSRTLRRPGVIPQQFSECWTDTSCPVALGIGVMFCEDKCNDFPGGPAVWESGLYPCGVCFGIEFDLSDFF